MDDHKEILKGTRIKNITINCHNYLMEILAHNYDEFVYVFHTVAQIVKLMSVFQPKSMTFQVTVIHSFIHSQTNISKLII